MIIIHGIISLLGTQEMLFLQQKDSAKVFKKIKIVQVNYPDVFNQTEKINIDQLGDFDSYANRDSLTY